MSGTVVKVPSVLPSIVPPFPFSRCLQLADAHPVFSRKLFTGEHLKSLPETHLSLDIATALASRSTSVKLLIKQMKGDILFEGWTLTGSLLSPTHARLLAHTEQISRFGSDEPVITFKFSSNPPRTLTIHRSFLLSAGGPLRALVTAPFAEAFTNIVKPEDSFESMEVLHKLLYCLPIDMSKLPDDMPLVAHRWQMDVVFQACFAWAELSQLHNSSLLVQKWMTVLALVQPPPRFCHFFARVFGAQFDTIEPILKMCDWTWGNYNIWDVFRCRGMLQNMVHTIAQFSNGDFSEVLLDVILRQLEDKLADEEAVNLLKELDWNAASCCQLIRSEKAKKWSAKAWRRLALTPGTGQLAESEDFRMRWVYRRFGTDFRDAPVCETKEGFEFSGLSFSLSLQSWCWKDPLSLKLQTKEGAQAVLRRFGSRRVSVVASAVEDSCSCGLVTDRPNFEEYCGEPWPHLTVTGLTLDSFAKDGGVEYVLMDPTEFGLWRTRHQDCGLLISVRLQIHDEEDHVQKTRNTSSAKCYDMNSEGRKLEALSSRHAICPCGQCAEQRQSPTDQGLLLLRSMMQTNALAMTTLN